MAKQRGRGAKLLSVKGIVKLKEPGRYADGDNQYLPAPAPAKEGDIGRYRQKCAPYGHMPLSKRA